MKNIFWLITGVILTLVLVSVGLLIAMIVKEQKIIRSKETYDKEIINQLQTPPIYQEIAGEMARYCQSIDKETEPMYFSPFYSKTIRKFEFNRASISPKRAYLERRSYLSCGYELVLDETNSTTVQNVWDLYFFADGFDKRKLYTVTLDQDDKISREEFGNQINTYFDSQIRGKLIDYYAKKIIFLLKFKLEEEARSECQKFIHGIPDHWWPRLILALVETDQGKGEEAATQFSNWVKENPSFTHYFYLSFLYRKIEKKEEAIDSLARSLEYPLVSSIDDNHEVYFYGCDAAIFAYENQNPELALRICKAMEDHAKKSKCPADTIVYYNFIAFKNSLETDKTVDIIRWIAKNRTRTVFDPYSEYTPNSSDGFIIGRDKNCE